MSSKLELEIAGEATEPKQQNASEVFEESEYYKNLRRTEYKKSDASLFPSYTNLTVP